MPRLLLASTSPRRREILEKAKIPHAIFPIKISEIPNENLIVEDQIVDIARQKAVAAYETAKQRISSNLSTDLPKENSTFVILSADTEVVWKGKLLGKPLSADEAFRTLSELSGKTHQVTTAVCFIDSANQKIQTHTETSFVKFYELSPKMIQDYIATGDPYDKAGSYGIQTAGPTFIEKLEGNYENVMGLPIDLVKKIIAAENWRFE